MTSLPITGVFNDAYIAELYESFLRDPASVDTSWRQFFQLAASLSGGAAAPRADAAYLRAVAGAAGLVQAVRQYGHLAVQLDPLGSQPLGAAELSPEFHGITEHDLSTIPGAALGFDQVATAAEAVARLREWYSSTIGFEFEHIEDEGEREWFREQIEQGGGAMRRVLTPEEKQTVLRRLTEVDGLERFLGRVFLGHKRFSIEGTDVLVPMLDASIEHAAGMGAQDVVVGMAHRGRLDVLAYILDVSMASIFSEFEGKPAAPTAASDTGDVKYHLGASTEKALPDGRRLAVTLVPNPSHLEFVDPVVQGVARAKQMRGRGERRKAKEGAVSGDGAVSQELEPSLVSPVSSLVLPILIHGDASFTGEGVVAETLNLSALRGYSTGGTLHIIANNQVGFTTDPRDGRSTYYASDLAKGFGVPIMHVNGDDAEACLAATWLALAYRERFSKDVLIDVVGYRRHGHNETDEPAYTQPLLYQAVRAHPTPREVWGARLEREGIVTADGVKQLDAEVQDSLQAVYDTIKAEDESREETGEKRDGRKSERQLPGVERAGEGHAEPDDTGVKAEQLIALNERLLTWPTEFHPNPKLARQLERRRTALSAGEEGRIDWGHAEALAWASVLMEGTSVRISGQDAERGTFSHRQAVLHDVENGSTYVALEHLPGATGHFAIYNSPLSETAVMGFEYGYSVASPRTLVLWEAQYGDFANVAAPIIDQFIAAGYAKWGQRSGLVLLLPHGYEGGGPEHSSARLERYLQLAAEDNLCIAYPSTPAQYFHILRRHAVLAERRPLVLMQPKSLLRLPQAASHLSDLTSGAFRPVIDDPVAQTPEQVQRLIFCTGKLYYDLAAQSRDGLGVALVRVEELYPWPHEAVQQVLDRYTAVREVVWAQEEPKNMGAWTLVAPRLRAAVGNATPIQYVGRPERASPAEGYPGPSAQEQERIVKEALGSGVRAMSHEL
ncbi:MAG TPA: 2-oxoglutarate dehydrogenase E1 component [Gemmatimonadaceae bacterium]|nr:2-oxoglutarate dehydrogenase E1 component [Gemmatimonadaceae bacterium]